MLPPNPAVDARSHTRVSATGAGSDAVRPFTPVRNPFDAPHGGTQVEAHSRLTRHGNRTDILAPGIKAGEGGLVKRRTRGHHVNGKQDSPGYRWPIKPEGTGDVRQSRPSPTCGMVSRIRRSRVSKGQSSELARCEARSDD